MRPPPTAVGPIPVAMTLRALEAVEARLLDLLDHLTLGEWMAPTIVRGWQVRHVAAHLLDTASRKLAIVRDGCFTEAPASNSAEDVRVFVDRLNAEGVRAYGRLSPAVMRALMAPVSAQLCDYQRAVDPLSPAVFAVSWAGETQSANWFDTARELTERWHHQAQIRLALDRPQLFARELYFPVLDCFMRVLPFAWRDLTTVDGARISVVVEGDAGGTWQLVRHDGAWQLTASSDTSPSPAIAAGATTTIIRLPESVAWRLFTKGLGRKDAAAAIAIEGDAALAAPIFSATAIVG